MKKKLFLLILIFTCLVVEAKSPDLGEMSEEEKQATGLNKLTPDELNALNDWLKNKQALIDQETRRRQAGFENRRVGTDRRTFKARVEKMYQDKLGATYYELDNGQIWKGISTGTVFLKKDGRQLVTIEPGMFGSWEMSGDSNRTVKVKRIK